MRRRNPTAPPSPSRTPSSQSQSQPPLQLQTQEIPFPRASSPPSASSSPPPYPIPQQPSPQQHQVPHKRSLLTRPSKWFSRDKTSSLSIPSAPTPLSTSPSKSLLSAFVSPTKERGDGFNHKERDREREREKERDRDREREREIANHPPPPPIPPPSPPRASFSFTLRRPTISQPSRSHPSPSAAAASAIAAARTPSPHPHPHPHPHAHQTQIPTPIPQPPPVPGSGDLRALGGNKGWSRSVDDLSRFLGGRGKDSEGSKEREREKAREKESSKEREREREREQSRGRERADTNHSRIEAYRTGAGLAISVSEDGVGRARSGSVANGSSTAPRIETPQPVSPFSADTLLPKSARSSGSSQAPTSPSPQPRTLTVSQSQPVAQSSLLLPFPTLLQSNANEASLSPGRPAGKVRSVSESKVPTLRVTTSGGSASGVVDGAGANLKGVGGGAKGREGAPPVPALPNGGKAIAASCSQPVGLANFTTRAPAPSALIASVSQPAKPSSKHASPDPSPAPLPPFLNLLSQPYGVAVPGLPPPRHPANAPPAPKHWKPQKVVLRGTKLYFWKVPSGREGVEVGRHFVKGVVKRASVERGRASGERERTSTEKRVVGGGGRKRAWWGRGRHPDLEVEGKGVVMGTPEGLVHESVFGTAWRKVMDANDSSIDHSLLSKSESKKSTDEEGKSGENGEGEGREKDQDEAAWAAFSDAVTLVLPVLWGEEAFSAEVRRCVGILEGEEREERARSVVDAQRRMWGRVITPGLVECGEKKERTSKEVDAKEDEEVDGEGLPRGRFMSLDPRLVARSLRAFHAARFPSPFAPGSLLLPASDPWLYPGGDSDGSEMHFLTRLVLLHILVESEGVRERKAVVERWVQVAEDVRVCGYAAREAVRRALGSAGVARLEGVWSEAARSAVVKWHEEETGVWRGGRLEIRKALENVKAGEKWDVAEMECVREMVVRRLEAWGPREEAGEKDEGHNEEVQALVRCWKSAAGRSVGKYAKISEFLAPSLAAQPKTLGRFTEHFWLPRTALLAPLHFPEGLFPSQPTPPSAPTARLMDGELLVRLLPAPLAPPPSPAALSPPLTPKSPAFSPSALPPSRPTSVATDVRHSVVSTLSRSTTLSRRSSLPPPLPTSQVPLRALVLGGTLDRLIDLLVAREQGLEVELPAVRDDMEVVREVKSGKAVLDLDEFARCWWAWFRAWVAPLVLFELLKKRFITPPSSNVPTADHDQRTRLGVLSALEYWIVRGRGAQDSRDERELMTQIRVFLQADADDSEVVAERREAVRIIYEREVRTPVAEGEHPSRPVEEGVGALESAAPSLESLTSEELVDRLDDIAAAVFTEVSDQDLIAAAEVLEVQLADRVGWFQSRDAFFATVDDVPVQNIYSLLMFVDASVLFSPSSAPPLVQLLPESIRAVIRGHSIIQRWLAFKVATPALGLATRQARLETLLGAMDVCRRRSQSPDAFRPEQLPRKRSFVESAISAALLSPESRCFTRAWQAVAQGRGTSIDTLASLLARPEGQPTPTATLQPKITVDLGWVLERMLELLALPNVLSSGQEGHNLVNLDKRRLVRAVIPEAFTCITPMRGSSHKYNADLFRLQNLQAEAEDWPPADIRFIKEDAYREQQSAGSALSRVQARAKPFSRTVALQQEKIRRDRQTKDRIVRELRAEREKNEKRDGDLNRLMTQPKRPNKATLQHKGRRSVTAFFRVVRPLSTAFTSDRQPDADGPKKPLSELDFMPSTGPSFSLSLVHARVKPLPDELNQRSFTFELETDDGGKYILQAVCQSDLDEWVKSITKASQTSGARRSTLEASSPKLHLSSFVDPGVRPPSNHPRSVYGVDLITVLLREGTQGDLDSEQGMPTLVELLINEVEARGLTEVGIYRISGASTTINALRDLLDKGGPVDLSSDEWRDIYAICDAIKMWFRMLPEPILPFANYWDFINAAKIEDHDTRLYRIQDLVLALPRPNFLCLRRLMEHLNKVTDYEEQNQMHAHSLAIVFGPNLLKPPPSMVSFATTMGNLGFAANLLKTMILQYHWIFNEPEEVDPAADVEVETPVTETVPVEEESFSVAINDDAVVVENPCADNRKSVMIMPSIDIVSPSPATSVDRHELEEDTTASTPSVSSL